MTTSDYLTMEDVEYEAKMVLERSVYRLIDAMTPRGIESLAPPVRFSDALARKLWSELGLVKGDKLGIDPSLVADPIVVREATASLAQPIRGDEARAVVELDGFMHAESSERVTIDASRAEARLAQRGDDIHSEHVFPIDSVADYKSVRTKYGMVDGMAYVFDGEKLLCRRSHVKHIHPLIIRWSQCSEIEWRKLVGLHIIFDGKFAYEKYRSYDHDPDMNAARELWYRSSRAFDETLAETKQMRKKGIFQLGSYELLGYETRTVPGIPSMMMSAVPTFGDRPKETGPRALDGREVERITHLTNGLRNVIVHDIGDAMPLFIGLHAIESYDAFEHVSKLSPLARLMVQISRFFHRTCDLDDVERRRRRVVEFMNILDAFARINAPVDETLSSDAARSLGRPKLPRVIGPTAIEGISVDDLLELMIYVQEVSAVFEIEMIARREHVLLRAKHSPLSSTIMATIAEVQAMPNSYRWIEKLIEFQSVHWTSIARCTYDLFDDFLAMPPLKWITENM